MSSHLDDRGFGGLALILSGALRIQSRKELEEFLDQPKAREVVHTAPYQDVFMVIKTAGLADSLELLPLTSREQRRGFIDLDCWRKDSFHTRTFIEWLAAFIQCGPEETVRLARAVDPEVLAYFLKRNITVHELDPEESSPDLPIALTPDGRFGIEIMGEGESSTVSRLLLDAVFRFDPALGHDLIDRVYWGNLVALEEEAYQNKRLRLEEIGFVDYYDALDIYGEARVTPPPNSSAPRPVDENAVPRSRTLPALFVASLASANYLREGLQQLKSPDEVERITHSLAALANRLLSVHSVTPGDLEKVKPALQELDDMLGLAVEYLSEGHKAKATEVLKQFDLQTIFRIGFKLIADLRSRADQVLAGGGLTLKNSQDLLLDLPEEEFMSGLRRQCPLFYAGLENPTKSSFRNFRSLADLQRSGHVLDGIEILSRGFWDLFPHPKDQVYLPGAPCVNLSFNEFRFQHLFNTALLNGVLEGRFVVEPLDPKRLFAFFKSEAEWGSGEANFQEWLVLQAESRVNNRIYTPESRGVIMTFVKRWVHALSAEFLPLRQTSGIDPRFVSSVFLRMESP
jgi:hypothetical protein